MKQLTRFVFLCLFALAASAVSAQDAKPMKSPPAKASAMIDSVTVTVNYHQPSARGRAVMGGLVPFGKVWRTGANETTSIEFNKPVLVEGKPLAAGKYALFTIPGEKEWTIILNKTVKWGSFSYSEKEDVLRVTVPSGKTGAFVETFLISVEANGVSLAWENTRVLFGIKKG